MLHRFKAILQHVTSLKTSCPAALFVHSQSSEATAVFDNISKHR